MLRPGDACTFHRIVLTIGKIHFQIRNFINACTLQIIVVEAHEGKLVLISGNPYSKDAHKLRAIHPRNIGAGDKQVLAAEIFDEQHHIGRCDAVH